MDSAKDFLIKACEMADSVLMAEVGPARDRHIAALTGYLMGLRDGYLVMGEMFEDISEEALNADDDDDK